MNILFKYRAISGQHMPTEYQTRDGETREDCIKRTIENYSHGATPIVEADGVKVDITNFLNRLLREIDKTRRSLNSRITGLGHQEEDVKKELSFYRK